MFALFICVQFVSECFLFLCFSKNGSLSLSCFTKLKHLRELRLKGFPSISLESSDKLKFVRTDSLQVLVRISVSTILRVRDIQLRLTVLY